MVTRIQNKTRRTFQLAPAGDPFYTPKIGGQPLGAEPFEICPGFDERAEDLVVPWAAMSRSGLEISEAGSSELVRCVVGPCDLDGRATDWLRLHGEKWEPILPERWLTLGHRHLLGAIGKVVDVLLTMDESDRALGGIEPVVEATDDASASWSQRTPLGACLSFDHEVDGATANTVFLNVYDLLSSLTVPNSILCNSVYKCFGAFHTTIEVHGHEWGFYKQPMPDACGICRSVRLRHHPVHVYRQSINLGPTDLNANEVLKRMRDLSFEWPSRRYHLVNCNCIHFCEELACVLGVKMVPSWVTGLHQTGGAFLRRMDLIDEAPTASALVAEGGTWRVATGRDCHEPPQGSQGFSSAEAPAGCFAGEELPGIEVSPVPCQPGHAPRFLGQQPVSELSEGAGDDRQTHAENASDSM